MKTKNNISPPQRALRDIYKNLRASAFPASVNKKNLCASASLREAIKSQRLATQHSELSPQHSPPAFTLLELILIIVITAILAVVVIPNVFSGYSTVRTSTAIRQIADDIRYCREEAIATRKRCRMQFDTGSNSYTVYLDGSVMTHPVNQGNFVVDLGSDITLTAVSFSGDSLSFNKFGNPAQGGTITLNGSRIISVEAETGTLDIQ